MDTTGGAVMGEAYTFKIRTANLLFGILVGSRPSSHEASAAIRLTMAGTTYRFNLRLPFFEARQ